jgi:regulatory protein
MPTITALVEQKKNRRRVNVYLDGQYAFGLQDSVAAALRVGQGLSSDQVGHLQEQDETEVAYQHALNYLGYRPRSCAEVQQSLRRRKTRDSIIEQVVNRLVASGLLDDEAFARYWVDNRETFRPRGMRSLQYELRLKGVAQELIRGATASVDESESAYRAASERARRLRGLDRDTFRRRLGGHLQRRGYGFDTVNEVVNRVWNELQTASVEDSD